MIEAYSFALGCDAAEREGGEAYSFVLGCDAPECNVCIGQFPTCTEAKQRLDSLFTTLGLEPEREPEDA